MVSEFSSVDNSEKDIIRKLSVYETIVVFFWFATIGEIKLLEILTEENKNITSRE